VRSVRSEVVRTWEELYANTAALAGNLRDLGVRAGERILILSTSRVEVIECVLAAFSIGAAAMPVGPTMGRATLEGIVRRMRPACCMFEDFPDPEVAQALDETTRLMVSLNAIKDAAAPRAHAYGDLIRTGSRTLAFPSFSDEHPALITHSSGSSGAPKAVVMTHGSLVRFFEYHDLVWRQYADSSDSLVASSAMVTGMPLNHFAGIAISLQGILSGRASYMMSFFVPRVYLHLIERTQCAAMLLAPSLYRRLLDDSYLQDMDRSALRCCILGGEPCPPDLIRRIEVAFGVPAVIAYSMTECLSGIGHSRREIFAQSVKPGSCGRQLFGEVSLRDTDGALRDDFGELWVRNGTVHPCYLEPEMNEARLRDGWFRTGDLFVRDADGNFFHRGRVDDMFICNGKNIYPLEMELLLQQHPGVEAACAAPVTSQHKGTIPAVLVVASRPLTSRDVQEHFRRNGPIHTLPQVVMFVDALPLLGSGKVDRRQAASLLQSRHDSQREQVATKRS